MIKVNCQAENYSHIQKGEQLLFFNEIYNDKTWKVLIASIAEIMLPSTKSFNIPVAIEVIPDESLEVTLDKSMGIKGCKNARFFIPQTHYNKWKKTYLVMNSILIAFATLICVLLAFAFASSPEIIMGIALFVVVLLTGLLVGKLARQFKLIKKYGINSLDI